MQNNIVSITSQGQLTIPKAVRKSFGIKGATKAIVTTSGDKIIVEPKKDFWSLEGALKSKVKLSSSDLRKAREEFSKSWGSRK